MGNRQNTEKDAVVLVMEVDAYIVYKDFSINYKKHIGEKSLAEFAEQIAIKHDKDKDLVDLAVPRFREIVKPFKELAFFENIDALNDKEDDEKLINLSVFLGYSEAQYEYWSWSEEYLENCVLESAKKIFDSRNKKLTSENITLLKSLSSSVFQFRLTNDKIIKSL